LDIASEGRSVEEARRNLIEAIELFFEVASPAEIRDRARPEVFIAQVGVAVAAAT
jgi:predicted RNase H-like HicB family nuclease